VTLPLRPPYPPMEALSVDAIPVGPEWRYEPKWDGFRCLAFRDGDAVALQSKSGQPLERYFPEIVEAVGAVPAGRFVLDGELVVPVGESLSFDDLLQRIHPAESRVRRLAAETPAMLIVFDLLVDDGGTSLVAGDVDARRAALEVFARRHLRGAHRIALSPTTDDPREARRWFDATRGALDGVIAKRRGVPYRSGDRTGMQKFKLKRTADCVVGGFRYASKAREVGSLLLGLHDDEGRLHHVGFTSGIAAKERTALTQKLEALVKPPGFTGNAPGGPSRWSTERSAEWQPLAPKLVVEVEYDHVSGGRFRHGTRLVRWRPDKAPAQCTFEQIERPEGSLLALLDGGSREAKEARRGKATPARRKVPAPKPAPRVLRGSTRS
jgi:ATP-dependent DNA ligase